MATQEVITDLKKLLGDEPDCDCDRPDRDAAHKPGCSWVNYMKGRLWLEERAWKVLAQALVKSQEALLFARARAGVEGRHWKRCCPILRRAIAEIITTADDARRLEDLAKAMSNGN